MSTTTAAQNNAMVTSFCIAFVQKRGQPHPVGGSSVQNVLQLPEPEPEPGVKQQQAEPRIP